MNSEHFLSSVGPAPRQIAASDCLGQGSLSKKLAVLIDQFDKLPLLVEDEDIRTAAMKTFPADVAALVSEGASGPRARQMLAVEIAASRISLKKLQGLLVIELNKYLIGKGSSESRVRFIENLADRTFRRFASALDLLHRLDPSVPSIRLSAVVAGVESED